LVLTQISTDSNILFANFSLLAAFAVEMQCEREAGCAARERQRWGESGSEHFAATLRQLFVSRLFVFVFICRVCGSAERGVGGDAGRGGSVGSGTQRRKCKANACEREGAIGREGEG